MLDWWPLCVLNVSGWFLFNYKYDDMDIWDVFCFVSGLTVIFEFPAKKCALAGPANLVQLTSDQYQMFCQTETNMFVLD